jgi:hypothetical protein
LYAVAGGFLRVAVANAWRSYAGGGPREDAASRLRRDQSGEFAPRGAVTLETRQIHEEIWPILER